MTRFAYSAVAEKVRAHVAGTAADQGTYSLYGVLAVVGSALGAERGLVLDDHALSAQVRRAMDTLSGEGTLVKVPRGEKAPDGIRDMRQVRYFTPAAYEAAEEARAAREERAAAAERRQEAVHDRLCQAGVRPLTRRGAVPQLSLEDWEHVAEVLRIEAERS